MTEEAVIDSKGRLLVPRNIRQKLRLKEGVTVRFATTRRGVIVRPLRKPRPTNLASLYGLKFKRTGKPEWATPKEIKSIWDTTA